MLLGIDLGGTKTESIALDPKRPKVPVSRIRIDTEAAGGYKHVLGRIERLLHDTSHEAGCKFSSLGIGTPGSINPRTGLLRNSNTQCLNGRPLKRDLEDILKMEVRIANDANCFTLAEAELGAGVGCHCVFGVILGTGVGGGIVIDGEVHHGHQGIGGEWGHNVLLPEGEPCYCGKRGCVETVISGPALEKFYRDRSGISLPLQKIVDTARADVDARECVDRLISKLGDALAVVINILDPDLIVLGGGVSNIGQLYTDLWSTLKPKIFCDEPSPVVVKNELGDSAGVFGAALLGR